MYRESILRDIFLQMHLTYILVTLLLETLKLLDSVTAQLAAVNSQGREMRKSVISRFQERVPPSDTPLQNKRTFTYT